jgi:hypothetical protein
VRALRERGRGRRAVDDGHRGHRDRRSARGDGGEGGALRGRGVRALAHFLEELAAVAPEALYR